jgi:hypothetical protein
VNRWNKREGEAQLLIGDPLFLFAIVSGLYERILLSFSWHMTYVIMLFAPISVKNVLLDDRKKNVSPFATRRSASGMMGI